MDTEQILTALRQERNRISEALAILERSGEAGVSANHVGRKGRARRHMSREARDRIAAAQRRRWAAVKAAKKK